MTQHSIDKGRRAEHEAATYLKTIGYTVLEVGWRQRDCEIDIVARNLKSSKLHMFEVRYRNNALSGDGLDSITPSKLQRMSHAAKRYVSTKRTTGGYELGAVSVGGSYMIERCIERIDL